MHEFLWQFSNCSEQDQVQDTEERQYLELKMNEEFSAEEAQLDDFIHRTIRWRCLEHRCSIRQETQTVVQAMRHLGHRTGRRVANVDILPTSRARRQSHVGVWPHSAILPWDKLLDLNEESIPRGTESTSGRTSTTAAISVFGQNL